jgi:uncharacterized protein (TIGR00290 family)
MPPTPVVVAWSGGKDSALALHALREDPTYRIIALLTTVTAGYERISIHGVRREVLAAQVAALGLPLYEASISPASSNEAYEASFAEALTRIAEDHPRAQHIAFGDLFLADVRAYREALLARLGWAGVYPLWGQETAALARSFVDDGFRAILCCVDTTQLDASFAGRDFDRTMLESLPQGVDPCGERGEFHTCVHAGPIFRAPLSLARGERVLRDERFEYCDLFLDEGPPAA